MPLDGIFLLPLQAAVPCNRVVSTFLGLKTEQPPEISMLSLHANVGSHST